MAATTFKEVSTSEAEKNKLQHAILIGNRHKSFMVGCASAELKDTWLQKLQQVSEQLATSESVMKGGKQSLGAAAAAWAADSTQNQCTYCDNKFTMVRRRHHCRSCGSLVCANCSQHRLLLRNIDSKNAVRTCDKCALKIEHRLKRAMRIQLQLHALIPINIDDENQQKGVPQESFEAAKELKRRPCFVKVFYNESLVGVTELSETKPYRPRNNTNATKSQRSTIEELPAWVSAKIDFEIEHLQRGTDDAGEPHRIFFELYLAPETYSFANVSQKESVSARASGLASSRLIGVGSISAWDVLLICRKLKQGLFANDTADLNNRKLGLTRKRSAHRNTFLRLGSFGNSSDLQAVAAKRPSLEGSDESSSMIQRYSSMPSQSNSHSSTDDKQILLATNVGKGQRRSSAGRIIPMTPLAFQRTEREMKAIKVDNLNECVANGQRTQVGTQEKSVENDSEDIVCEAPVVQVKMVNASKIKKDILGENITIISELELSATVAPPDDLELRDGEECDVLQLAEAVKIILSEMLPHSQAIGGWNIPKLDSEVVNNMKLADPKLAEPSEGELPSLESMASYHTAILVIGYAVEGFEKLATRSALEDEKKMLAQSILNSLREIQKAIIEDPWNIKCDLALTNWRTSHSIKLKLEGMHTSNLLTSEEYTSLGKRGRSVFEVVATEVEYMQALELLDEHFVQVYSMRGAAHKNQDDEGQNLSAHDRTKSWKMRRIPSSSDATTSNLASVVVCLQTVTQLKTLHKEFLSTLKVRVAKEKERMQASGSSSEEAPVVSGYTDELCIGDLFERFGSLFGLYSQYQNNYDFLIDAIGTNETLSSTMTSFRMVLFAQGHPLKDRTGRGAALGHLVKPMERMLQYNKLLSRVLDCTSDNHPDYTSLKKAVSRIQEAQAHIKKTMRERENKDKILEIERSFVGRVKLLVRGRLFVRQGPLVKVCRKEDKKFFFWLFSDLLIYGHAVGNGRYKFHRSMDIANIRVSHPDVHRASGNPCFTIASQNKSFVVYAQEPDEESVRMSLGQQVEGLSLSSELNTLDVPGNSSELRNDWYQDIYELTHNYMLEGKDGVDDVQTRGHTKGTFAPVWQTDKSDNKCQLCGIPFTLTRRRHHCRICGRLVCFSCSPHRLSVTGSSKKVRVCNACEEKGRSEDNSTEVTK